MQVVLLVLVGFAVDYGLILLERTRLQNAVDAASLAGARAMVDGASPGIGVAEATTLDYLELHGYIDDAATDIAVAFPPTPGSGLLETVAVDVTRQRDTYFLRLVGIDDVTVAGAADAAVDRRMIDIMLSLDLTGSMELSGTSDLDQLRQAAADFINMVNPSPSNPLGAKIGMARFAGRMCQWWRQDSDLWIDIGPGPSEYRTPCTDDKSVLTNLTLDKNRLLKIANNSGPSSCPPGVSQYACPLVSWRFTNPTVSGGSPGGGQATPNGLWYGSGQYGSGLQPDYTGTRLPNGISVVSEGAYHAWSTANGGRNNASGEGWARKVLVMMTDGFNEVWPDIGNPESPAGWDTEVRTRAATLKLGPDGVSGTNDDVEIYVVGFFCTPYSTSTSVPQKWCKSRLADTAPPHPCPGAVMPGGGSVSAIDILLRDVSSSAPGACDRYFPIRKTEDLPTLFQNIAGTITRARLTS